MLLFVHKLLPATESNGPASRSALTIALVCEGANNATPMNAPPQPGRRKSRSELTHLRSLPSTQPGAKIGQVTWALIEIEASLAAGMKLKEVWEAAKKDGLDTSYAQLRVYISRLSPRAQTTRRESATGVGAKRRRARLCGRALT